MATAKLFRYRVHDWLLPALWDVATRSPVRLRPIHLLVCCADHFEPYHGNATTAAQRLDEWLTSYPPLADRHRDADGRPPRHTFFYPFDQSDPAHLRALAALCAAGYGEIEVHLHHGNDTEASLTRLLRGAVEQYRGVGALGTAPDGEPAYGFVHGNWALDNSGSNGRECLCGVNNELQVLARTGCYADFTFPALGATSQPRIINRIYYATDDPLRPKSHDRGVEVRVGGPATGDLMLIVGPLGFGWRGRPFASRPYLEDGDFTGTKGWWPARVDCWVRTRIHVRGRPDWVFIKFHTHGAAEANCQPLLRRELEALFTDLETRYNDGINYCLHYVTAREAYNIAKAAEAGLAGNPFAYRDYRIAPPPHARCLDASDRTASSSAGAATHESAPAADLRR